MAGKLAPAVRKETLFIAVSTGIGTVLMFLVFGILHMAMPEKVPFDHRVILAGIGGCAVAVLNFYLMAVTVQKVASAEKQETAANTMKASYVGRFLMQILWAVAAVTAPCFQFVAGLVPLLFPGAAIKLRGLFGNNKKVKWFFDK